MSKHESKQAINVDEELSRIFAEDQTDGPKSRNAGIESGPRSSSNRKNVLVASIASVSAIAAAWFIRNSVLYEKYR
jgi:hypothetical protein